MISKIQISFRKLLTTSGLCIPLLLILLSVLQPYSFSQEQDRIPLPDTLLMAGDSLSTGTLGNEPASMLPDTSAPAAKKEKKNVLEDEVKYTAEDSFRIVISEQKIYLYKGAGLL